MQPRVFLENDPDRKRQLQGRLTAQLPDWFGKPASNANYAKQAEVWMVTWRRLIAIHAACFC
jgi:hypothetical protein